MPNAVEFQGLDDPDGWMAGRTGGQTDVEVVYDLVTAIHCTQIIKLKV